VPLTKLVGIIRMTLVRLAIGGTVLAVIGTTAVARSAQVRQRERQVAERQDPMTMTPLERDVAQRQALLARNYVSPRYRISPAVEGTAPDLDEMVTVEVEVAVDRDGGAKPLRVVHGDPQYAPAALQAAGAWKFLPPWRPRTTLVGFNMGAASAGPKVEGQPERPGPCSPAAPPSAEPEQPVPPDPCEGHTKLIHYTPPLPEAVRRRRIPVTEILNVVTDRMGKVTQASAVGPLSEATSVALDAVFRWRFVPTPVPIAQTVTMHWEWETEIDPDVTAWLCVTDCELRGAYRHREDGKYHAVVTEACGSSGARPASEQELEHRAFGTRQAAERQLDAWHLKYLPRFMEQRRARTATLDTLARNPR
jgi:hypothetical protein